MLFVHLLWSILHDVFKSMHYALCGLKDEWQISRHTFDRLGIPVFWDQQELCYNRVLGGRLMEQDSRRFERERLRVVIGGKAYVLTSIRDRAYTIAVASEADHLLEHLKLRYPRISDSARRTLAVVNVLDQKNDAIEELRLAQARSTELEEKLARALVRLNDLQASQHVPKKTKAKDRAQTEDVNPLKVHQQNLYDYLRKEEA